MPRLLAVSAMAGVLCCAIAPAIARGGENGPVMTVTGEMRGVTRSQTVSLRDLDLRENAEVSRAESRIRFASKQVCDVSDTTALYQKRDYGACFGTAIATARSDLGRYVAMARGR